MIDCDFSYIEGTNCYCSPESADFIRTQIRRMPLEDIHFIGTGDYHYISLFWAERIGEPFILVLLDNHPDDQPTAFSSDLLSCGDWVEQVRRLPLCRKTVWIRKPEDFSGSILENGVPVYVSIDLDVLSREYAMTDWDQGDMTLGQLMTIIRTLKDNCRIIGADLCGGLADSKGATEESRALNARTMDRICRTLV